jgi:hypothetical protein
MVLDIMKPDNEELIELYQANKELCIIIALGQCESHGMALLG